MNFYLKLKHQQARNFREKYINQFLQVSLIILISIWIIQCTMIIFEPRQMVITNPSLVSSVSPSGFESTEVVASKSDGKQSNELSEPAKVGKDSTLTQPEQSDVEKELCLVFKEECQIAKAVAMAESSMDVGRIGDKHMKKWSYGLFQINQTWHPYTESQLLDYKFNIKIAKEIRDKGSWDRWTTFRTGQYLQYM